MNIPIQSYTLAEHMSMAGYFNDRFDAIEWKGGGRPTSEDTLRLSALAGGDLVQMEEIALIICDLPPSNYIDISRPIDNKGHSSFESHKKSGLINEIER